jgi:DtxR family Mn-dependent transcriptional regulator
LLLIKISKQVPSLTEENYLKAIYFLQHDPESKVTTNAIAQKTETKASSVSDMLKRLKEKELIHYKKYQAISLTPMGQKVAISIIRKHRLWEYFLVEKLHFGWDEVHDLAEQLEHIESVELTNRLEKFLNFPKLDPHGDPIPDRNGKFPLELRELLSGRAAGEQVKIIGVKDHSTEFLNYLDQLNIRLGTKIEVLNINSFDQSLEIKVDKRVLHISNEVARNLYTHA